MGIHSYFNYVFSKLHVSNHSEFYRNVKELARVKGFKKLLSER